MIEINKKIKFINKSSVYIDDTVIIEPGVVIGPNVILLGQTIIKSGAKIGMGTEIINSVIDENTDIINSYIIDSIVGKNCNVGPYAYIRNDSLIKDNVKVGNHVEVKNSSIDENTKIAHLSYVGDSIIGKNVNIGAGSITVNYDGKQKHKTIIGNNVFVGCNVNLIAPLEIEDEVFIAAGSTITDKIKKGSFSIARQRQTNKKDYYKKLMKEESLK